MVDILMAAYNGEEYIAAQIESIMRQSYTDWTLIIRDDGSSDRTIEIIEQIAKKENRIKLITDKCGNKGVIDNFELLLKQSKAKYIMLADQDDIWLPDKVSLTLNEMLKIEKENKEKPILVFTDATVVDQNLKILNNSYIKTENLDTVIASNFERLPIRNCVMGCTIMINFTAKELVLPFNPYILMHDWWIAGKVAKTGHLVPLCQHTILYRQHEKNVWGTKEIDSKYYVKRFFQLRQVLAEAKKLRPFLQALGFGGLWRFWYYKCLYFFLRRL